jgi:hypothetical protein
MPFAQMLLRPIASLPLPAIRRSLSAPVFAFLPALSNGTEAGVPYREGSLERSFVIRHLQGSAQVNPTGAIHWQGNWVHHPSEQASKPDLLVHYASRRKTIEKALILDYTESGPSAFGNRILPRIAWLQETNLTDRLVLVGVGVARQQEFQRSMRSGRFVPLKFEVHREDTRLDCIDLLLPIWPKFGRQS